MTLKSATKASLEDALNTAQCGQRCRGGRVSEGRESMIPVDRSIAPGSDAVKWPWKSVYEGIWWQLS